jgi:hypothetical protein
MQGAWGRHLVPHWGVWGASPPERFIAFSRIFQANKPAIACNPTEEFTLMNRCPLKIAIGENFITRRSN